MRLLFQFLVGLATVAAACPIFADQQYVAKIKVMEANGGKALTTIAAPTIVYAAGQKADVQVGDHARTIEITVCSLAKTDPDTHAIFARIIEALPSKPPVIFVAPKIVLTTGQKATVCAGNSLLIEATVEIAPTKP